MLNPKIETQITEIRNRIAHHTATGRDYSEIIRLVREYRQDISDAEKRELLQIPLDALTYRCVLKQDSKFWAKKNGAYFASNCIELEEWKQKFDSGEFKLADIADFLKFIMEDDSRMNSDFYLRNPEVVLRYDVSLT